MKKIIAIIIAIVVYQQSFAQITIAEARSAEVGTVVTVTGIVTNGDELGIIRYIQDETGGIGVYPNSGSVEFTPVPGDEVTVTGSISEFASLLEISDLTSVTINSSGNALPDPILLTPAEISETYEGQLVRIEDAVFSNPGATFAGNTNYTLTVDNVPFVIRINSGTDIVGEIIPAAVNLTAIVSQYSWGAADEGYQLLPRGMSDFEIATIFSLTSLPVQSNITKTGFTISWSTNDTALTRLDYGLTSELELGTIEGNSYVTNHVVNLTGLEAGKIYYAKAYSINAENDTVSAAVKVYATESNSSGDIKVYFNHPVASEFSNGAEPIVAYNTIEDTIISYIEKAESTIDIVIYDVESEAIVEALNAANANGVTIRYITDIDQENAVLDNLANGITLFRGNSSAIMHDKFIIIDAENTNNSWVVTGSINHTYANLGWDLNNMVCIQDQALARAYTLEFNEMWGSNTTTPNEAEALFGANKTDNTPHQFIIGGKEVELFFSPSDQTTSHILRAVESADYELNFGIMVFTENTLGSGVLDAYKRGVNTMGIIDYVEYTGDEFDFLLENGVRVIEFMNPDGSQWPDGPVFHHKYAVIDYDHPDADPVVITGSHNWSGSAESSNDENTLIIHDVDVANMFHQEFMQRYYDLLTPVLEDDLADVVMNEELDVTFTSNDFVHYQVSSTTIEFSEPVHGTYSIVNDSTIHYIPDTDFYGRDSMLYKIINDDYTFLLDSAYIKFNVLNNVVFEVTAIDDTISMLKRTLDSVTFVKVNVLENDINENNLILNLELLSNPMHGSAELNETDSTITYYPTVEYVGFDTITYRIYAEVDTTVADTAYFIINVMDYDTGTIVNKINIENNVLIYPNPGQGDIHIEFNSTISDKGKLIIIDNAGRKLYHQDLDINSGNNKTTINTSGFEKGIYYIMIQTREKRLIKPLIVQ